MALNPSADPADDHAATVTATAGPTPRAELQAEIDAFRGILASAPVIEQAKGAIMLYSGVTADTAFAVLRDYSQRHNIKVRDLAAQLTKTLAPRSPTTPAHDLIDRILADQATPPAHTPGRTRQDHQAPVQRPATADSSPSPGPRGATLSRRGRSAGECALPEGVFELGGVRARRRSTGR